MTFEEEKQAEAMRALHETEKRCESNDGFIKVMKRKMKKKSEVKYNDIKFVYISFFIII